MGLPCRPSQSQHSTTCRTRCYDRRRPPPCDSCSKAGARKPKCTLDHPHQALLTTAMLCISIYIYLYIYIYIYIYIQEHGGPESIRAPTVDISGRGGTFFDFGSFFRENGPVGCCMRWALIGSFEHTNRELLALYICGNIAVFVLLCVGFSVCYVQSLVCVMCSL